MQTSRNDPCPCGSGKKYKKCCLTTDQTRDHEYRRWLNIERSLIHRLTVHALSIHDEETLEDAWFEFNCSDEDEMIRPDSPMNMVFMPWFLFNWTYEVDVEDPDDFDEITNAESFLEMYESELSADEVSYLESALAVEYSLCEVRALKPDEGMTLRDLLTLEEFFLQERLAAQSLSPGEIIYCARMEIGGFNINLATGPYPLRPITKRDIIELRTEIMEEAGLTKVRDMELYDFAELIRGFYLNCVDGMFRPPSLVNSAGDEWVFHKLYFDLKSVDEAFHKFKDLSVLSEEELRPALTMEDGRITSAEIGLKDETNDDLLFGVLTFTKGELVLEVNSEERAKAGRELVEQRLGELVTYRTSSIVSLDDEIKRMWDESLAEHQRGVRGLDDVLGPDVDGNGFERDELDNEIDDEFDDEEFDDDELFGDDSEFEPESTGFEPNFSTLDLNDPDIQQLMNRGTVGDVDPDDPKVQEMLKRVMEKHWSTWFDMSIPALNDMTPREAVQTEIGRDLLESLLWEYEINIRRSPDNPSNPDVAHLRHELGIS